MTKLSNSQKAALFELDTFGTLGNDMGISRTTMRSLERLGLAEVRWGERRERMAPAGWTGRVYVTQPWFAQITDKGRALAGELS
jgi:hypothetical protein